MMNCTEDEEVFSKLFANTFEKIDYTPGTLLTDIYKFIRPSNQLSLTNEACMIKRKCVIERDNQLRKNSGTANTLKKFPKKKSKQLEADVISLKDLLSGKYELEKRDFQLRCEEENKKKKLEKKVDSIVIQKQNEICISNSEADLPIDPDEQFQILRKEIDCFKTTCEDMKLIEFYISLGMKEEYVEEGFSSFLSRIRNRFPKKYIRKYKEIMNDNEIMIEYKRSICLSMINHTLMDTDKRDTLGIRNNILNSPIIHARAPVPWHQNVINGKNFMTHNLFIGNLVVLKLRDLWHKKYSKLIIINSKEFNNVNTLEAEPLCKLVDNLCKSSKMFLITRWLAECVDIIKENEGIWSNLMDDNGYVKQGEKFFRCIHSLMSLQLRSFVMNSLNHFLKYVMCYANGNYTRTEYKDCTFLRRCFIVVEIIPSSRRPYCEFSPSFENICFLVNKIGIELIKVSENIPSMEQYFFKDNDIYFGKRYLHPVRVTENEVQSILLTILDCCLININGPVNYLNSYRKYTYLLAGDEEASLKEFLNIEPHAPISEFIKKIEWYNKLKEEVMNLRREVYLNLFQLVCDKINKKLHDIVNTFVNTITDYFIKICRSCNRQIANKFEEIARNIGELPDTTSALIQLSKYIEECKTVTALQIDKQLLATAEYIIFLMEYAIVSDDDIALNTKIFCWPKELKKILTYASSRITHKKEVAEGVLKTRKLEFHHLIKEHSKQLDIFRKKDPPVLTLTEMKETTSTIESFVKLLIADKIEAEEINEEERLLDMELTCYAEVYNMLDSIKPFNDLWSIVLHFHICYEKWYKGPFAELNASEVKETVDNMWQDLYKLSQCLYDAPGSKRICEIVLTKIEKFQQNIPILQTICNRGLQERHWVQISEIVGVENLKPKQDSSLGEMVGYGLGKHIESLNEISVAATEEYKLQMHLAKIKEECNEFSFKCQPYRDTDTHILTAVDNIELMLDDHLLRVQTMRSSPHIAAIEDEVEQYEDKLILIQDILDLWLQVEGIWMYLEPLFRSEDIVRQMPDESMAFQNVNTTWKSIMDYTVKNAHVLKVAQYPNMLETLSNCKKTLETIKKALNQYLEKKRQVFPRFFFLSNGELLEVLSEGMDLTQMQSYLKCFRGISSLKITENMDIVAIISEEGEVVNLSGPVSPLESKGIMERWLDQLEDMMMQSLCDINNKAIRSFGTNDEFSNWILQNPAMISHCAFYVNWTLKVENIISSIVDMKDYICKLEEYIQDIIMLIRKEMCARDRGTLSSMVLLLIHLRNITEMLVKNKTNSVKDFNWLREMRYYSVEQKIIVQMVTCKFAYGYEYIGNISPLVVTTQTDRYYRLLMGSLENHLCPILRGNTATGKTDICKDLANALAKPFIVFNCTSSVSYGILHMFLRGVIQTGTYFCFDEVDHMQYKQCAILGDLIHKINNAIRLKKDHLQIDSSEIPLNPSCGMFFTSSNKLKENLPENLRLTLRPIMTIDPELLAIIHSLLRSYGYIDWKILGQKISDIHKFLSSNLLTENHYKYDLRHFKICIESLKLMKYNNLQENETIVVRTALEDFYASQLSNQDTELLKYLCDKFFICNDNKLNENIEKLIQKIMEKNNLIGDLYTKKIVHLYHAYKQRRSIILIGNAISGKTTALKCLFEILQDEGKKSNDSKVQNAVINVKSMNMDELYGCLDTNSNEWKDGVFSRIFREYVDNVSLDEKMIIFDTGMDAIWMEGISTVLDNNKTLCLASGEMIKMNEKMNIVFETDTLDYVSPSTISRCSVIYFDENLVTWKSLLMSFVKELDAYLPDEQLSLITDVTEWLFPPVLSFVKKSNAIMLNVSENYAFVNYSRLLRCMLDLENTNLDTNVSIVWLQCIIVFCFIWSIAANLPENERETFDCFFRSILAGECESYPKCRRFKLTKHQLFPEKGTVFDWCCDKKNIAAWIPWLDVFPDNNEKYACNETACQTFLLNAMINAELPVFVIGPPSSGKTSMITNHLSSLPNDKYVINTIPVSATTTSNVMQEIILSGIDRRRKGVYGASMGKKCVIFVDDVNSLSNDVYDTKSTIEILRQIVTYRYCYDKQDSSKIELTDLLFINSCKSFSNINNNNIISERYLHQMNTIFVMKIQDDSISTLFTSMLDKHFSNGFNPQISRLSKAIYTATRQIYDKLVDIYKCDDDNNGGNHFLEFNIKDLFRVLRGITRMTADKCQGMDEMFRLWLHELLRVFGDRIVSYNEREDLLKLIKSSSYQNLRQRTEQYLGHLIPTNENEVTVEHLRNLMFGDYLQHDASRAYDEISDENALKQYMEEKMKEYVLMENIKPIVVFKYFIQHVSRVIRALQNDKGHMILIGLEGSGRKTILKFSAFILNYEVVEINTTYPYNTSDCKNDLKGILLKAGYEGKKLLLMLGDENISNHSSYIMDNINMFLTIGHVPHLFNSDEKSDIMDKMIEIVHHMGSKMDTAPSVLYRLFANRVKENLHIAIILDAAKEDEINEQIWLFPALSNYCTTNIITQWPKDALQEVAIWYFEQYSLIDDKNALNNCVAVCKEIHDVSIEFADSYNKEYGRKIYITPETYFKLLRTFVDIYKEKMEALTITKQRYENGLEKLHTAAKEVTSMKNELQILRPKLLSTSDATEKLMIKIEQNTITIEATKEIVAADEALANDAAAASQAIRDDCESDLAEAEPALQSATTALNTLQPADITVIKAMKNPPHIVKLVLEAICVMKGFKAERRTDVTGNVTEDFWMSSLKLLGDAKFLEGLKTYDKDNIDASVMKIIREKYIPNPDFNPHIVKKVSNACEGLVRWVKAMEIYDRVIKIVGPKKVKLLEAETDYTLQMEKLNDKRNQLAKVVTKLQSLRDELAEKTKQKKELEDSIEMCTQKLDRAGKLIDSLASEKDRWRIVVNELEDKIVKTVGDVLICSAVISYLAPYNYNFRSKVIKQWRLLCQNVNLPLSENSTISSILCDIDQIRSWNMAGLPVDEISIENSLIIANSKYPVVIIDQQGECIKWVQYFEINRKLHIIDETDKDMIKILKEAIENGLAVLINNISRNINNHFIGSLLQHEVKVIDGSCYMIICNEQIPYDRNFKLYMTTYFDDINYYPQITNKITLVDLSVTCDSIQNRLLKVIIKEDAPLLEEKKCNFISENVDSNKLLRDTEDRILNVLSSTKVNILEDEIALQALRSSKTLLNEIQSRQSSSWKQEEEMTNTVNMYIPICKYACNVFFCVSKLSRLRHFYHFSLDHFLTLFEQSVKGSDKKKVLEERLECIKKNLVLIILRHISPGLFTEDRLILAFMLCLEISKSQGVTEDDFQFLTYNEDQAEQLTHIIKQENCEKFSDIIDNIPSSQNIVSLRYNKDIWNIVTSPSLNTEDVFTPLNNKERLNLIGLLQFTRPESHICSIQNFVCSYLGEDTNSITCYQLLHDTNNKVPVICVNDDSNYVLERLRILAQEFSLTENDVKIIFASLIQDDVIENELKKAMEIGNWITFVTDCPAKESDIIVINDTCKMIDVYENPNSAFRFFIITNPYYDGLSRSILLKSLKITFEELSDIWLALYDIYRNNPLNDASLYDTFRNTCDIGFILYLISFCHAILKMQIKVPVSVAFSPVNIQITISYIKELLPLQENKIDTESIRYLIKECNYGAHVDSEGSRNLIDALLQKYCNHSIRDTHDALEDFTYNGVLKYLQKKISLKETDQQAMKINSNVFQKRNFKCSKKVIKSLRDVYYDKLETVDEINQIISEKIEMIFMNLSGYLSNELDVVGESHAQSHSSTSYFLSNELRMYRKLVRHIKCTLRQLKSCVSSSYLQDLKYSFWKDELPNSWLSISYPTNATLKNYVITLSSRLKFMEKHCSKLPEVIPITKLYNVRSLFDYAKLEFASEFNTPIDEIGFIYEVSSVGENTNNWNDYSERKKCENCFGFFMKGLALLNCRYNASERCLDDALCGQLLPDSLPIIWAQPILKKNVVKKNIFSCPLYYVDCDQNGINETKIPNFISNVDLPSFKPNTYWITRSAKIILQEN